MKKTLMLCGLLLIFASICIAANKEIEFRMVISEIESKSVPNDVYSYSSGSGPSEKIFVSKKVLFSNVDIEKAVAVKKEDTRIYSPEVRIFFKPDAAKRFEKITGENIGKKMAIICNGKVLMAPIIRATIASGQASIAGEMIATNEQAEDFAKSLQRLK